ncbi:hypothetical protein [Halobaculum magnesiiphilum]|uniref:Uncharacterized protein n=1 Tax=Halobaculum magnesiiphilum TaxID=1017351 RepID=A0A8T8W9T0_9EURY|nr:hypothetical protein [Halobaculum magnesiiphilum]QZP36513.1 hypothetical protein K6T50_09285 [Halobaculum magnesiiphilum]
MNGPFLAAATLTLLSLAGYIVGTIEPYPGREAAIAGLLVGVTLATVTYRRNGAGSADGEVGSTGTEHVPRDGGESR